MAFFIKEFYTQEVNLSRAFGFVAKIIIACIISAACHAELYFAPELLSDDPNLVADLSHFQKEGSQLPGVYQVDIYLNGNHVSNREVKFIEDSGSNTKNRNIVLKHDSTGLMPCLSLKTLSELGVKLSSLKSGFEKNNDECIAIKNFTPEAYTAFDFQKMRLDISVPQAFMKNSARGSIPPELWDDGINAFLLNYNFSGNKSTDTYASSKSHYLNLNSGANIGPWRLRDVRNWNEYQSKDYHYQKWQHVKTYIERAIVPLRSQLIIGDNSTKGEIFDSLGFRGLQLSTDENMLPDSQRGFAPVIRGNAMTNAKVSIRQNGYSIYQTFVSPGPFRIDDLYPLSSSGDLEVTVREADGSFKVFTVPYSSVPILQREGNLKYSLTTGQYKAATKDYNSTNFLEGTLIWGGPHNTTIYSGTQYANHYISGLFGFGFNFGTLGALSLDVTHANSELANGKKYKGQSLRFLFSRSLNSLGTSFQLTGYRYSTKGFHTLDETTIKKMKGNFFEFGDLGKGYDYTGNQIFTNSYDLYKTRKARIQASISQRIGTTGTLFLSGERQTYWNSDEKNDSLQIGVSDSYKSVNYSLNYSYNKQAGIRDADHNLFLTMSVPLDSLFSSKNKSHVNNLYASFNASRNDKGELIYQTGLSGSALESDKLNWNISQGHDPSQGSNNSLNLNYQGAYGNSEVGYSYSKNYRQVNYGVSGGVLLHNEGITFAQPFGDTSILVAAPGIPDVPLENETGVRTDFRGYTVKPYASIYRENRVALDTNYLNEQTDIESAVTNVVPTRGAIVKASFKAYKGYRLMLTLLKNGSPLPFGTIVSSGDRSGIVGDDGQVYISGMPKDGNIKAEWGVNKMCMVNYKLNDELLKQTLIKITGECK